MKHGTILLKQRPQSES